jgi:hypothetical protein
LKITLKHIFIALVLGALLAQSASAQVRVTAAVESSEDIYVGQRFTYHLIIENADKSGVADITPLAKFDPRSSGTKKYSSSSFTIVNGKRTRVKTVQSIMTYQLVATNTGTITLPPVSVTVDGQTHTTNPVEIQVVAPATTDKMELKMLLSAAKCYTGQPVVLTVRWFIHSDIVNSIGDFNFAVPAFTTGDFFIEDTIATTSGNHNHSVSGVGVYIAQQPVKYKDDAYAQILFNKIIIPKRHGKIKLAPAIASAQLAVGRKRSRGFFGSQTQYKQFSAESEPLVLDVLPLPEENKSPAFYGLVGQYNIETAASPTSVHMGDPITLTIKIGGNDYLKPVRWPDLEKAKGFENFKIPAEKASPVIQGGSKIFTQTIRANNSTVTEIPSVSLAYFDSEKGTYKTIKSKSIPLEVAKTKRLGSGDVEGTTATQTSSRVEAIKSGISANVTSLDALIDQDFSISAALLSPAYLIFWALPLAGLLATAGIRTATNKSPERIAAARRRNACKVAIDSLKKLRQTPSLNDDQKRQLLIRTMQDYIGQRFDRPSGSLTASDCYTEILNRTGDEQAARNWQRIFENCQQSFYTGGQSDFDTYQTGTIIELLRTIDRKASK